MLPSSRFGNFVLHERLAVGGMGELFLASHIDRPAQPLALKILLKEFRERADFVSMFRDEARIGMRLAHKNIVGVQEVGDTDGIPWIVMEYVHGENLRSLLRALYMAREPLSPELAVRISIEVLEGLDHAHRARDENGQRLRLVHRDLSPDNILLSYEGEVKILDFGIAKAEGRSTETQFGVLKGKAQYMPPEQANGRAVDARSDLFALGILLLETITGEKRFKTDDAMAQYAEARGWQPRAPSTKVPGIPPDLDVIVVKATQPEPSRRWQNADEFSSAMTRLLRSNVLPKSRESLTALLRRLFPDTAGRGAIDGHEATSIKARPRTLAAPTAIDPDMSAPPRWASDDEESGAIPGAQNLAENESTRLGPGAAVEMHGREAPRTPKETRLSAPNLADDPPSSTRESGRARGEVPVAEGPVPASTSSGAPTLPGGPPPLRKRPKNVAIPRVVGGIGTPKGVPQPIELSRVTGPLFPAVKRRRRAPGLVALTIAVGVIAAAASMAWHFRDSLDGDDAPAGVTTLVAIEAGVFDIAPAALPMPTATLAAVPSLPAATPEPTRAPAPKFAALRVTSKPSGAAITVDGKRTGKKTPATFAVASGSHSVQLSLRGYKAWSWNDRVRAGDSLTVAGTLRAK